MYIIIPVVGVDLYKFSFMFYLITHFNLNGFLYSLINWSFVPMHDTHPPLLIRFEKKYIVCTRLYGTLDVLCTQNYEYFCNDIAYLHFPFFIWYFFWYLWYFEFRFIFDFRILHAVFGIMKEMFYKSSKVIGSVLRESHIRSWISQ